MPTEIGVMYPLEKTVGFSPDEPLAPFYEAYFASLRQHQAFFRIDPSSPPTRSYGRFRQPTAVHRRESRITFAHGQAETSEVSSGWRIATRGVP